MTLPNHDSRSRDDTCVYYIPAFNGSVVCSRPNIVLGDFYRSGETMMSGSARMNSEVTGKSERDRKMEEIPQSTTSVAVNPSTTKPKEEPK